jgi:DNA-binding IclR family transcriptional regulator
MSDQRRAGLMRCTVASTRAAKGGCPVPHIMNREHLTKTFPVTERLPDDATPPQAVGVVKSATGTQAIERAILLLKLLATRGRFGWGLTEISRRAGLDKATARRILACLETERLVDRDFHDQRYFPGPMIVELGLSVAGYPLFLDECRQAIARLSKRSGGAAFAYLRSGPDFVVAGRAEESIHRGMLNEVGFRRPLISSAGGVAILIALPAPERELIVEQNLQELARTATRPERFQHMLERSLRMGYAVNLEDVATGINSFALRVPDAGGAPFASISVAGEPERFPDSQSARFLELLSKEASDLAQKATALFPDRGLMRPSDAEE